MLQRQNITIFLPSKPQGKPKNAGVGSLSLLQQIFLTQGSNHGLLICRWILYQLSYQGNIYIYIYIYLFFFSFKKFALSLVFETCCFKYIVSFLVVYRGSTKSISYIICSPPNARRFLWFHCVFFTIHPHKCSTDIFFWVFLFGCLFYAGLDTSRYTSVILLIAVLYLRYKIFLRKSIHWILLSSLLLVILRQINPHMKKLLPSC